VFLRIGLPRPIATLDLRIDYLKPATPPKDVVCKAECFKATTNVAFVRAMAFHDDESDPIAAAAGSFMIFAKGKRVLQEDPA
jgi:acyl-coenzyme A thioesterase PaaI-like protein